MIYEERGTSPQEEKAKKTAGPLYNPQEIDNSVLETFPYEYPRRKITVELRSEEFTCVCPFSGLPDFAMLTIRYVPRKKILELKAFKYYLLAYRQVRIYNEHAVNKILEDVNAILNPRELEVIGEFTSRGGIKNRVTARIASRS
ncbi:MAG: NADPH-dependent 7-cyano-7-deazaguanine reductase QueF [Candidatus Omnitrophica bacterium]|nr:NADPH-dependent 7-cyano-7-deazaguanine reductase QueF [Candidatus Omnitrophota bacterium]